MTIDVELRSLHAPSTFITQTTAPLADSLPAMMEHEFPASDGQAQH